MVIEAELIHSRGAEAEMLFPVLRDSEVASNWQDFRSEEHTSELQSQ